MIIVTHVISVSLSSQHAVLQMIKDAVDQNGGAVRDDSPVTEVLSQVCPSSWRGACKTAVQLLFGQAGLVSLTLNRQLRLRMFENTFTRHKMFNYKYRNTAVVSFQHRRVVDIQKRMGK